MLELKIWLETYAWYFIAACVAIWLFGWPLLMLSEVFKAMNKDHFPGFEIKAAKFNAVVKRIQKVALIAGLILFGVTFILLAIANAMV